MRVAVLGRTRWLLDAAELLVEHGHTITLVATAKAEQFYDCDADDFDQLARKVRAEFLGEVSLAKPDIQARLRSSNSDIAISINWPNLVRKDVIDIFPGGIINAHCGDLPRYRGNACPNWAIINGEKKIGLCAHMMEPDVLDAGAVIARAYLEISDDTYIGDVYAWLDARVPTLLVEAISGLELGSLQPVQQDADPTSALRCYPRRPEDSRIYWNRGVKEIIRLIRASSRPFSGAFASTENGRKVIVWRAGIFEHKEPFCAVPGQVMLQSNGDPVIACLDGAILLEDVDIEGLRGSEAKQEILRSLRGRLA